MASEEVISCPACRHALRVPANWLGTPVQCPECKSSFRAPTYGSDGRLGEGVLVAEGESRPMVRAASWMLTLPAIGLVMVGLLSVMINLYSIAMLAQQPEKLKSQFFDFIQDARQKHDLFNDDPQDEKVRKQLDEGRAEEWVKMARVLAIGCAVLGAITFAGGLSILTRRFYGLALLGCVAAAVNIMNFCCVPGAVLGIWGLVVLITGNGREHFRRLNV